MAGLLDRIRGYERQRRFWRLVDVRGRADCWAWHGQFDHDGRALYRGHAAHEHAWQLMRGPLPAGAPLERTCGDARCVNPEHFARPAGSG
jgi:hypothetical protein